MCRLRAGFGYSQGCFAHKNRKEKIPIMKKITVLALSLVLLLSAAGCSRSSFNNAKDKTFSKDSISIVLTTAFAEKEQDIYTAVYDSVRAAVYIQKEEFELAEGFSDLSLQEYAQLVIDNNGIDSEISGIDGLTYFVYERESEGKTGKTRACVYKSDDAFWLIHFACDIKDYDGLSESITKWAKSVEF